MKVLKYGNLDLSDFSKDKKYKYKKCTDSNGKSYGTYMAEYCKLMSKQQIKHPNMNKQNEFNKILELFPKLADRTLGEIIVKYSEDELDVTVIFRTVSIVGDINSDDNIVGKTLALLFHTYNDHLIQPSSDGKCIEFIFHIKLFDIEETDEYNKELAQLDSLMKNLFYSNPHK